MDEMENTSLEMNDTADQQDAFLEGWDGSDAVAEADQPDTAADEETAENGEDPEEAAADAEGEGSGAETTAQQEPDAERQEAENGESRETAWIIKHNGTEMTVRQQDITPELLQKGVHRLRACRARL